MRRSAALPATVLAVLAAAPAAARAEINIADSIEWMTARADVVVRGTIVDAGYIGEPGTIGRTEVTVSVRETLKGRRQRTVRLNLRSPSHQALADWQARKTELLVFLVAANSVPEELDPPIGPWVLADPIAELGSERFYDMRFDVLSKRAEVLATIRAAAHSTATRSHRIDVPYDAPAFAALYGGSAVWLTVPVDANLEALAQAWLSSKDLLQREEAIRALGHFRTGSNIRRIEKLLFDPDFAVVTAAGAAPVRRYLARAAAHKVLTDWAVAHGTPVIEEPAPAP